MGGGGAVLIRVWVLRAARSLTPVGTPNFDVNLVQNIGTESIDCDWFSGGLLGRRRVAGSAKTCQKGCSPSYTESEALRHSLPRLPYGICFFTVHTQSLICFLCDSYVCPPQGCAGLLFKRRGIVSLCGQRTIMWQVHGLSPWGAAWLLLSFVLFVAGASPSVVSAALPLARRLAPLENITDLQVQSLTMTVVYVIQYLVLGGVFEGTNPRGSLSTTLPPKHLAARRKQVLHEMYAGIVSLVVTIALSVSWMYAGEPKTVFYAFFEGHEWSLLWAVGGLLAYIASFDTWFYWRCAPRSPRPGPLVHRSARAHNPAAAAAAAAATTTHIAYPFFPAPRSPLCFCAATGSSTTATGRGSASTTSTTSTRSPALLRSLQCTLWRLPCRAPWGTF